MSASPILIKRIRASGLLSFGPNGMDLPLGPLNVLIGPNGSGKSNLIDALALLPYSPDDVLGILEGGGGSVALLRSILVAKTGGA